MLDLIEQSTLYRIIVIVTTLASFVQIVSRCLGQGSRSGVASDLSRVVVAALLGGVLFPIIIVLVPGRVGSLLYDIFSFGNPSYLVITGLIAGGLLGVIYRQLAEQLIIGAMVAMTMAVGIGLMAFLAGGVVAAIASGGQWGAIIDQAWSWGKIGAMIGAVWGLIMGATVLTA